MTSTSRGTSRNLMEYDSQKSQEWLRRRKLRLEQVRKQSKEIARSLRQKVMSDEKLRLNKYDRISQANFRDWKADKMNELEWKLKSALDEFGDGYKQAEAEPDPNVIMEELNRVNFMNAQKRGEIAQQEVQRVKKQTEEKKMSPINRKKLTRKKEDLRSALIRCVTVKKSAGDVREGVEAPFCEKSPISAVTNEKLIPEKPPVSRVTKKVAKNKKESNQPDVKKKSGKAKRKKRAARKSCLCKNKSASSESFPRSNETVWINLNEIQSSSTGELGLRPSQSESLLNYNKTQSNRPEGTIEFYDFTSRFHCRTYREYPHVVERINPESIEPNATELAEMEDENSKAEAKKWEETEILIQGRGMEALRREKINRDYNNLVSKLEELYKKEKILKSQQRSQPTFLHMSEERLSERLRAKQRLMDSKFENLYYQETSHSPVPDSSNMDGSPRQGGGDWAALEDETHTSLSLSPSNFKHNTPVGTDEDISVNNFSKETCRKQKRKKKKQLLEDIERTLREGRELRKTVSRNQDVSDVEDSQKENLTSDTEREATPICEEKPQPTTRTQECQTENLKAERNLEETDVSLPVSTSTCYKSPPSVLRSNRVQKFLEYLEGISETEDSDFVEGKQPLKKKIDKLMYDLLHNSDSNKSVEVEEKEEKSHENLTLEYYVGKLLTMSRECIANLSVSSENVSTPNVTDLDLRETKCAHKFSSVEELVRQSRLNRANCLEETIKNWRRVLEKDSEKETNPEPEDVPDCARQPEPEVEPERSKDNESDKSLCVIYNPKMSRYEEITKKCAERISELSQMLDKVRKDKEKLLSSASGGSSLSLNKEGRDSVNLAEDEEPKVSAVLMNLVKKYKLEEEEEKTSKAAVGDSKSKEPEESFESWPDVMEELLKRNILTSPFKWTDGEHSSDFTTTADNLQPSSIETVMGNFRKEISKIKPFTLSESTSSQKPRQGTSEESYNGLFSSPRIRVSSRRSPKEKQFQEETSIESINQALTSLGLNWAKSFLRKNEESKAINSSSNSERKSSDSEEDLYP